MRKNRNYYIIKAHVFTALGIVECVLQSDNTYALATNNAMKFPSLSDARQHNAPLVPLCVRFIEGPKKGTYRY